MISEPRFKFHTCEIFGNGEANQTFHVREMHHGMRDEFEYFECSKCGCLRIVGVPSDISKYYPTNYYSYVGGGPTLEYPQAPIPALRIKILNEIVALLEIAKALRFRSSKANWVAG